MEDDLHCLEFIGNTLDAEGANMLRDMAKQINVLAEEPKGRFPISRQIMAGSTIDEVCQITDYLEHILNPDISGNETWIESVSQGEFVWRTKWAEKLNDKLGLIDMSNFTEALSSSDVKEEASKEKSSSPSPANSDSTPPLLLTAGASA
jgi:hypothetical protein